MARPIPRPAELTLGAIMVLATVLLLCWMPPLFSMATSVLAAITWCLWIDRHPAP
jgi:hypothetical protein